MLQDVYATSSAELRFSSEMLSFWTYSNGVIALVPNSETGQKTLIHTQHTITYDGSGSVLWWALGTKVKDYGLLGHSITIYFKMDVEKYEKGKFNGMTQSNNPNIRCLFGLDQSGLKGFLFPTTASKQGSFKSRYRAGDITNETAADL